MSDTPATPTRTDYGYGCFASELGKKGVPLVAAFDELRNDGIIFAYVVQAPFHISKATQKANADYTVLALNSHATLVHQRDALVKALEPFGKLSPPKSAPDDALVVLAATSGGIIDVQQTITVGSIRRARAALKLAETQP